MKYYTDELRMTAFSVFMCCLYYVAAFCDDWIYWTIIAGCFVHLFAVDKEYTPLWERTIINLIFAFFYPLFGLIVINIYARDPIKWIYGDKYHN